jgi:hypothetical protein
MPEYRFYTLTKYGQVARLPVDCECADDDAAIREAGRIAQTEPVEIWQGMRKVALLKPPILKDVA